MACPSSFGWVGSGTRSLALDTGHQNLVSLHTVLLRLSGHSRSDLLPPLDAQRSRIGLQRSLQGRLLILAPVFSFLLGRCRRCRRGRRLGLCLCSRLRLRTKNKNKKQKQKHRKQKTKIFLMVVAGRGGLHACRLRFLPVVWAVA